MSAADRGPSGPAAKRSRAVGEPQGRHLVLVGMMGSGKTTLGRAVAARLGRPFLDSDATIEERTGRTVRQIFEADGEPAFRRLEAAALADAVHGEEPAVIAAAGGVVLDPSNRALLRRAGRVVWLRAEPATLAGRVKHADHRPLLADDPAGVLRRLSVEREPLYREVADEILDVDGCNRGELVRTLAGLAPASAP